MEVDGGRRNGTPDGFPCRPRDLDGFGASVSPSLPPHPRRSLSPCGADSIEHRVSKMDTLAGIAIKYGVEVADIKRMNGLVSDLQMFAFEKLQIPLPGKHPPSPVLSNGGSCNGEHTPPRVPRGNLMDSFLSLKLTPPRRRISDAMSNLQGYYGLTPMRASEEGTEMSVYRVGKPCKIEEPKTPPRIVVPLDLPPSQNPRLTRSAQDNITGKRVEMDQRHKTDTDMSTPELLIEESKGSSSSRNGKGLALRPKSGSRTDLASAIGIPTMFRKSSSTPNLEDSDSPSLWSASMWTLTTESITRPLLEGLPKPITFLKMKAARD